MFPIVTKSQIKVWPGHSLSSVYLSPAGGEGESQGDGTLADGGVGGEAGQVRQVVGVSPARLPALVCEVGTISWV